MSELAPLAFNPWRRLELGSTEIPAVAVLANPLAGQSPKLTAGRDNRNYRNTELHDYEAVLFELETLEMKYQACLELQKSPDYKWLSPDTLRHEAEAFARMDRQRAELLNQLSHLTPRGN